MNAVYGTDELDLKSSLHTERDDISALQFGFPTSLVLSAGPDRIANQRTAECVGISIRIERLICKKVFF